MSYNTSVDGMRRKPAFTVVIEPDSEEGGFVATVPDLPGAVGRGETEEEALRDVKAKLKFALEGFDSAITPETLARKQGVSAADFDHLLGDFWPEEGPEEFTTALREWRREPERRVP